MCPEELYYPKKTKQLKEKKTLVERAKENGVTPNNLKSWKKIFLENAEMAMEPSRAFKEYKDESKKLQDKIDKYAKTVGQLTVENNWMRGKLRSSDLLMWHPLKRLLP